MAKIDKFIGNMRPGQELLLESDKMAVLRSEGGGRSATGQIISGQQIIALIEEIAPANSKDLIRQMRTVQFAYSVGPRTVMVVFVPQGEAVSATITLITHQEESAEADYEASSPSIKVKSESEVYAAASAGEPRINGLLRIMNERGASDLHITSGHKPMIRIDGEMNELSELPAIPGEKLESMIKEIMPSYNASQFEKISDTDFAHHIERVARFRVNAFRDRFGAAAVFRRVPIEIIPAEKLGLTKEMLDLCFLSKGLVLVTGPTGSGKTTTLCALIDFINRNRRDHILTIEDPIEFIHEKKNCLINQREVHVHTRSFSQALRAALREDPDIVLVGEMRDLETISTAIETAETGHLVFGTLHTTTAGSTVDRIIDQYPAERQPQIRAMLATSLKGVLSQTLCRRIGGGRIAAIEALFVNGAVSNMIREGKIYQIPSVMQTSRKQGMALLNDVLFRYVMEKKVTPEEAYIKSVDKQGFLEKLTAKSIELSLTGLEVS